jgi:hypothetical protein
MHHTPSKRYQPLQPEERMTIASLRHQQYTVTQIAQLLRRIGWAMPSNLSLKTCSTLVALAGCRARASPLGLRGR